jgi:hypothetical protein
MRHERETRTSCARRGTGAITTIAEVAILALAVLAPLPAHADVTTQTAAEFSLLAGYSDETGWVHELPGAQRSAIGFEQLAKFSGGRGDIATTDLQVRLSYDSQAPDEAWAIEVHNAWIEYKLGLGKKLRFGHFSPAHGLEPVRDTHGTLIQTLSGMDIGFKKDWGVAYSGIAGPVDLEVALQLGSGAAPAPDDGSFLASAQVWTPPGRAVGSTAEDAPPPRLRGGNDRSHPCRRRGGARGGRVHPARRGERGTERLIAGGRRASGGRLRPSDEPASPTRMPAARVGRRP